MSQLIPLRAEIDDLKRQIDEIKFGKPVDINQRPAIVTERGEIELLKLELAAERKEKEVFRLREQARLEGLKSFQQALIRRIDEIERDGAISSFPQQFRLAQVEEEIENVEATLSILEGKTGLEAELENAIEDREADLERKENPRDIDILQGVVNLSYAEVKRPNANRASPFDILKIEKDGLVGIATSLSQGLQASGQSIANLDQDVWMTGHYSAIKDDSSTRQKRLCREYQRRICPQDQ